SRTSAASAQTGYGTRLQSADLDEDGYADLLSVVSWTPKAGESGHFVVVNWGGPKGLSATPTVLTTLPDAKAMTDFTIADVDADLPSKGGALIVVYGGPNGTSTTRKPVWINQDTPGVPGAAEFGDGMGSGLSIGDTNGDGYPDVATGLPGEDFDGITNAGTV